MAGRKASKSTSAKAASAAKAKRPSAASKAKAAPKAASKAAPKAAPRAKAAASAKRVESTSQTVTLVSRLLARALAARLAPKGIGYGQFPVLQCLWDENGLTQKELSQRVRIEAPTMVRTLDRMEREGLVERVRSETDRRQIHIQLTKKGQDLKSALVPMASDVNEKALGGITKKDRKQLDDLLAKVVSNLEKDAASRS